MAAYASIAEMMQASAAKAIGSARERFGFHLDYSEASLGALETILANVAAALSLEDAQAVEYETKLWGSYLGEVVRQRWGGAWELCPYPGSAFTVPAVNIRGSQLFPLIKVYRRIALGEAEEIGKYYQMVRQKLAPAQPADGPTA
jgi:hypothetical protein